MNLLSQRALVRIGLVLAASAFSCTFAHAQLPASVAAAAAEAAVDTAAPIVIKTLKPKKVSQPKFEGTVVNATIAQITVRDKENEMSLQTFPLSEAASVKMLRVIDKGGYQYGDKVTVFYDPQSRKALKVKGKPSKAL
jgi:hypothetical protein